MALNGMGMMMKSLGIDPDEMKASIDTFMGTVKSGIEEVRANQTALVGNDQAILLLLQDLNRRFISIESKVGALEFHDINGRLQIISADLLKINHNLSVFSQKLEAMELQRDSDTHPAGPALLDEGEELLGPQPDESEPSNAQLGIPEG